MAVYDIGDSVPLTVTVLDPTGAPADATTVSCTIYQPDGTTVSPTVTHGGVGIYSITFSPTIVGTYNYKFVATGSNAGVYPDAFSMRDPFDMPPFSVEEAREHLNIRESKWDDELRRFMDVSTRIMEKHTNRVIARKTVTENHPGGSNVIFFRNPSALSISSLIDSGNTLDPSAYITDPYGHFVERIDGSRFNPGIPLVQITFVAGFLVIPPDLIHGIKEILAHLWQTQRGAISVMNQKSSSDEYDPRTSYTLPRRVREIADHYRLPRIG